MLKYRSLMQEAEDVKCSFVEGDENSNKMVCLPTLSNYTY